MPTWICRPPTANARKPRQGRPLNQPSEETRQLRAVAAKPALQRLPTYLRLSGPGWLQGAMTLGGGSAITSLTIGAVYGYELLWVQPLAMLIGCIMLFALSHQTLSIGERPFVAMARFVNPAVAWAWAIAALVSSIIWGFSHYPLSAGMLEEIIEVGTGFSLRESGGWARELYLFALAVAVWCACAWTAWNYGSGGSGVRLFETGIKLLSTMIVLSFAWVVISASHNPFYDNGIRDPVELSFPFFIYSLTPSVYAWRIFMEFSSDIRTCFSADL